MKLLNNASYNRGSWLGNTIEANLLIYRNATNSIGLYLEHPRQSSRKIDIAKSLFWKLSLQTNIPLVPVPLSKHGENTKIPVNQMVGAFCMKPKVRWDHFCSNVTRPHITLQWRCNERDGVSNHQPHDCLLNRLFRRRPKKTPKLHVTGLCAGNSPVKGTVTRKMFQFDDIVMVDDDDDITMINITYWWHSLFYSKANITRREHRTWYLCQTCRKIGISMPFKTFKRYGYVDCYAWWLYTFTLSQW